MAKIVFDIDNTMDKNSLLIWYPKIKDLDIPQPRTEVVTLTKEELKVMCNEQLPMTVAERVEAVIKAKFKLPVFLRTDLISGKHGWDKTCYYDGTGKLWKQLLNILVDNLLADKFTFTCFVIREYIPMASAFTAFYGNMPVNPERRYFIKGGAIKCHHPYWIKDSILPNFKKALPDDWPELLEQMNNDTPRDVSVLTWDALKVADKFKGHWSVDFCKAANGRWILIDMATAKDSWHPEECKFNVDKEKPITWRGCGYYWEMYDLRHTWGSMRCNQKIIGKPDDCSGCPLSRMIKSKEMIS